MLKWRFPNVKILFYCHYPQQLVTPTRFFLYRWYSRIIGLMEGLLFQKADIIMVNSHFTGNSFNFTLATFIQRMEKANLITNFFKP